jgi:hypothetical protein
MAPRPIRSSFRTAAWYLRSQRAADRVSLHSSTDGVRTVRYGCEPVP